MSENGSVETNSLLTPINELTNAAIKSKIMTGDYKISSRSGRSCRSKVWTIFGKIQNSSGEEIEKIVVCRICYNVYSFTTKCTSNLVKHRCYIASTENETDIIKVDVDAETKNSVTEILTEWTIQSCRPYGIVADTAFQKVGQFLISVGAQYGKNVNTETLLPNPTIISSNIKNIYNIYFQKLKVELSSIKYIGFGLTSDLWTDNYLRKTYISLTIHYIKDGALISGLLGMKSMEGEKCTNENVKLEVTNLLEEYDLELNEKVTMVTDCNSNMVAAFRNNKRICCVDRLLQNTMQTAMQEVADVAELSRLCFKLVKYLNISDFSSKLNAPLTTNRWNTIYYVFMTINENKKEIVQFLQENDEMDRLENINFNFISAIITLLQPFEETFKKLEGDSYPTIHLVYPYIHYLTKACRSNNEDLDVIKLLQMKLSNYLESIVLSKLQLQHKLALFLFPPTNKLAQLPDNERQTIKDECKILMKNYISDETDAEPQSETLPKIIDHNTEVFAEFICQTESNNSSNKINSEILKYEALNTRFLSDFNVLQWWEVRKNEFPHLYKVSQQILATPASSAASERIFSMARNLISDQKSSINDSCINEIMFLNSNMSTSELEKELLKIYK